MDNEDWNIRLKQAIDYVRSQRKMGIEIALAIDNASKIHDIDRTVLARKISALAKTAKIANIAARKATRNASFAKWGAADKKRYDWMNN